MAETAPRARAAQWVAAGILLSRLAGLIRERAIAHYFGATLYADVLRAALRLPNFLQNLLGEGTLSASFIPVYSELLEEGREEEAGRVAGAVFALLFALAGALTLIGTVFAPVLVDIFLWGFEGQRRELTIAATRILFPMTGILVLSAWALGILNSHRRFFVSYIAPVLWNAAIIAALLVFGGRLDSSRLLIATAWGALAGGLLQFGVQLPWVIRLDRRIRVRWNPRLEAVRTVVRNAGPAIAGRGVVQVSGYLDIFLASFLVEGAVAALGYAQTLYILPISLFGMSVAAAELPELSRQRAGAIDALRDRVNGGLRQIAFFVVPSVIGYVVLGDVIVAALYQSGDFGARDTILVYLVLAGYSLGLLASTATRLYNSAFFALRDTRTPAKVAALRVVLAGALGAALMLALRDVTVDGRSLGPVGLSVATGIAAWVEWGLLRRSLQPHLGRLGAGASALARMFGAALLAAGAGRAIYFYLPDTLAPLLAAVVVLIPFAILYFALSRIFGLDEAADVLRRASRRIGR